MSNPHHHTIPHCIPACSMEVMFHGTRDTGVNNTGGGKRGGKDGFKNIERVKEYGNME